MSLALLIGYTIMYILLIVYIFSPVESLGPWVAATYGLLLLSQMIQFCNIPNPLFRRRRFIRAQGHYAEKRRILERRKDVLLRENAPKKRIQEIQDRIDSIPINRDDDWSSDEEDF